VPCSSCLTLALGVWPAELCALARPSRLTDELVKAYDLQQHMTLCACGTPALPLLPPQEACRFHTDSYVRFLQQIANNGIDVVDEAGNYALNASVCFSETAWRACLPVDPSHSAFGPHRIRPCPRRQYAQIYAGASVDAASSLSSGAADIAINWIGGQTHARRDCASGFSYVNDVVLAILTMLRTHERVMFVSSDACHPSGVEEAFYTTVRCFDPRLPPAREAGGGTRGHAAHPDAVACRRTACSASLCTGTARASSRARAEPRTTVRRRA
jgi:histone deacetylase 1/2